MKQIRTRRGWEAVVVAAADGDTAEVLLSGEPLTVSNKAAAAYESTAADLGVEVVVSDADGDHDDDTPDAPARTPDLSEGIAATTGQGDPVETPTTKARRAASTPAAGENTES